MEDELIEEEKESLTYFEQYILSLLIAAFIYGGTLFCLNYLGKLLNPYLDFSENTIKIASELKELFLLDRKFKYLIPLIIYLFFFGLSMQSFYAVSNKEDK